MSNYAQMWLSATCWALASIACTVYVSATVYWATKDKGEGHITLSPKLGFADHHDNMALWSARHWYSVSAFFVANLVGLVLLWVSALSQRLEKNVVFRISMTLLFLYLSAIVTMGLFGGLRDSEEAQRLLDELDEKNRNPSLLEKWDAWFVGGTPLLLNALAAAVFCCHSHMEVGTSNGEDIFAPRFMWDLVGGSPAFGKSHDHRLAQFLTESMRQHPAGGLFRDFPAGGINGLEHAVHSVEDSKTWLANVGVPGLGGVVMRPDAGGRPTALFYVVGGLCALFYLLGACYFAFFAEAGRRAVAILREEYYGADSDSECGEDVSQCSRDEASRRVAGGNPLSTQEGFHGVQTANTPSFTADYQQTRSPLAHADAPSTLVSTLASTP